MSDLILADVRDGVATLTLHRPEKLNAFTIEMAEALVEALDRVATETLAHVLVITGAGRAFSAGGDVKFMMELKEREAPYGSLKPLLDAGGEAIRRIEAFPGPTIAAVHGVAAGGGMSLALACDLRLASDQASFIESFVRIGLCVDWGGAYYLPRLVGQAKAMELCWTAEPVDAHEALRLGLVNRVIAHDRFAEDVRALARQLAQAPQTSLRRAKAVLRAASTNSLEQTLAAEIEAQAACWNSHDSMEGVQAFGAKRPPVFGAEPAARSAHRFE